MHRLHGENCVFVPQTTCYSIYQSPGVKVVPKSVAGLAVHVPGSDQTADVPGPVRMCCLSRLRRLAGWAAGIAA